MDRIDLMAERRPDLWPFRDRVRALGTDNLSHFGNGYTHEGGYSIQQNPDEFACLVLLLRERTWERMGRDAGVYLEIGSASGGVLRFISETVEFAHYVSIDDGGHHRAPEQDANFRTIYPGKVHNYRIDSHSSDAKALMRRMSYNAEMSGSQVHPWHHPEEFDEPFIDVAFIDGDHSYEGVKQDIELVRPFLNENALVIFHDTLACEGVARAWEESQSFLNRIAHYTGTERPLGIGVGVLR